MLLLLFQFGPFRCPRYRRAEFSISSDPCRLGFSVAVRVPSTCALRCFDRIPYMPSGKGSHQGIAPVSISIVGLHCCAHRSFCGLNETKQRDKGQAAGPLPPLWVTVWVMGSSSLVSFFCIKFICIIRVFHIGEDPVLCPLANGLRSLYDMIHLLYAWTHKKLDSREEHFPTFSLHLSDIQVRIFGESVQPAIPYTKYMS